MSPTSAIIIASIYILKIRIPNGETRSRDLVTKDVKITKSTQFQVGRWGIFNLNLDYNPNYTATVCRIPCLDVITRTSVRVPCSSFSRFIISAHNSRDVWDVNSCPDSRLWSYVLQRMKHRVTSFNSYVRCPPTHNEDIVVWFTYICDRTFAERRTSSR